MILLAAKTSNFVTMFIDINKSPCLFSFDQSQSCQSFARALQNKHLFGD